VITFDDGYADNLHNAKPLLERYDVPATVFVSTGYVKSQREFWQDELDKIFLQPGRLPDILQLAVDGQSYRWELGAASAYGDAAYQNHCGWNVLRPDTPSVRHQLYRSVFELLFPLSVQERERCVLALLAWSHAQPAARPTHRPLSEAELLRLGDGGLVEIGGHTVNHPVLSCLSEDAQRAEISGSKAYLDGLSASPVVSFAYPYGGRPHYTDETVAAVRDAGFTQACSNFAGFVRRGTDRWQLPRFLIRDWPGEVFRDRLSTWFGGVR
jgi:peptidoglycan/xylan/chitin deacetylase (PgdA/CDA1 family)